MTLGWFYVIPHRFRWLFLLIGSCYFYMVFVPKYIIILFCLILVDYFAGLLIESSQGIHRKSFLIASLAANIGILAFFKYCNIAENGAGEVFAWLGIHIQPPRWNIILPIGLSFHTFQSMSYTIEVYRRKFRAERHLGLYSLYVLFYPQMVAGPIERPRNLLPQFHTPVQFVSANVIEGVELMLWGLFKKSVIADNLALIVDPVYQNPRAHPGWAIVLATYAFAIQIYCDFSGYTDIARGAARTMGYHLMLNFDRPYHAQSIAEFWRRWHISLSTWFRDYVYFPLGGNRVSPGRQWLNLMTVFLISGLWHGASLAFITWGALHGIYMIFGQLTCTLRERLWHAIHLANRPLVRTIVATVVTFHLVWFSWVFFRAGSLRGAINILSDMSHLGGSRVFLPSELDASRLTAVVISLLFLTAVHYTQRQCGCRNLTNHLPNSVRIGSFCGGVIWILLWGRFASQEFLYFQF